MADSAAPPRRRRRRGHVLLKLPKIENLTSTTDEAVEEKLVGESMTRAPKRRRRGSDQACTKNRMSRALRHLRFLHMLPKIELPKKFTDEEIVKQMEKEIPEQYMSFQTMLGMSSYRLIKMVYI